MPNSLLYNPNSKYTFKPKIKRDMYANNGLISNMWGATTELPGKLWGGIKKDFAQVGSNMSKNLARARQQRYGATEFVLPMLGTAAITGTYALKGGAHLAAAPIKKYGWLKGGARLGGLGLALTGALFALQAANR